MSASLQHGELWLVCLTLYIPEQKRWYWAALPGEPEPWRLQINANFSAARPGPVYEAYLIQILLLFLFLWASVPINKYIFKYLTYHNYTLVINYNINKYTNN